MKTMLLIIALTSVVWAKDRVYTAVTPDGSVACSASRFVVVCATNFNELDSTSTAKIKAPKHQFTVKQCQAARDSVISLDPSSKAWDKARTIATQCDMEAVR